MSKEKMIILILFLIFIKLGVNKICAYLEELDSTMQQVHMELFKIRVGEDKKVNDTK